MNENIKAVDGLSQGQRVDPDKQNKQDKRQLNKQYINLSEDESSVLFYNYILWKGRNFSTESSPLWNGKKIGCQN